MNDSCGGSCACRKFQLKLKVPGMPTSPKPKPLNCLNFFLSPSTGEPEPCEQGPFQDMVSGFTKIRGRLLSVHH